MEGSMFDEMPLESQEDLGKEFEIVPKIGTFLGLDISENSSGVCLYKDGKKYLANIGLETPEGEQFFEVKCRRELGGALLGMFNEVFTEDEGYAFDLIVIEDAFQGINPKTTRKLYAINTAIDELILDGKIECKKFVRVNNQVWKGWLYKLDVLGSYKGLVDKERIRMCLSLVGISERGKGYQDRLDAQGMLIGYFLRGEDEKPVVGEKVRFSDLEFACLSDTVFLIDACKEERGTSEVLVEYVSSGARKWSKELVLEMVNGSDDKDTLFITRDEVVLGNFGKSVGVEGVGYLGFWIKKGRLKKYIKAV